MQQCWLEIKRSTHNLVVLRKLILKTAMACARSLALLLLLLHLTFVLAAKRKSKNTARSSRDAWPPPPDESQQRGLSLKTCVSEFQKMVPHGFDQPMFQIFDTQTLSPHDSEHRGVSFKQYVCGFPKSVPHCFDHKINIHQVMATKSSTAKTGCTSEPLRYTMNSPHQRMRTSTSQRQPTCTSLVPSTHRTSHTQTYHPCEVSASARFAGSTSTTATACAAMQIASSNLS